jgi:penicillin-binding protein 1A
MVLTAAVRKGVDPNATSYTSRSPITLQIDGSAPWTVKTFGGAGAGTMSLTRATLASDNSIYAQLIVDLGPTEVCETAKLLGIVTKLDCFPAEGLGGLRLGVTPLEMASAYATLASGGVRHRPTAIEKVVFPDGKSENLVRAEGKRVLTDGQADAVTEILEMNITSGTGVAAGYGCPAAGKTGTTDEAKDAWFVGYTPNLSTSVWVGYPDANIAMPGAQGGTHAAPVWHAFMSPAAGEDCSSFPEPEEAAEFTPFYGKYASSGASSSYSDDDSYSSDDAYTEGGTTDDETTGGETTGDENSGAYVAPPQNAPEAQPPPAASPAPQGGGVQTP